MLIDDYDGSDSLLWSGRWSIRRETGNRSKRPKSSNATRLADSSEPASAFTCCITSGTRLGERYRYLSPSAFHVSFQDPNLSKRASIRVRCIPMLETRVLRSPVLLCCIG